MNTPLAISLPAEQTETWSVGDCVYVELFGDKHACARVLRRERGETEVRLIGLGIPEPYMLGDVFMLADDKILDW